MNKRLALVLWLCLAASAAHADDSTYVSGIEDLPLMPGLKQSLAPPVEFDKPDGRIVSTDASGKVSSNQVVDYYQQTLPQLGWLQVSPVEYVRGDEALDIGVRKRGGGAMVHFQLQPKS